MLKICERIKTEIIAFKVHIPVINIMCNLGLRDRHWTKMSQVPRYYDVTNLYYDVTNLYYDVTIPLLWRH